MNSENALDLNKTTMAETQPNSEPASEIVETNTEMTPSAPSRHFSKLIGQLSSIRVRYKIAGTFIVVLSLTVISLGLVTFASQKTILQHEMKARAAVLVQQLANAGKEALLTKQELPIASTVADVMKRDDVVYAMVTDSKGNVFVHNDFSLKGTALSGTVDKAAMQTDGLLFQESQFHDDAVLDAAIPIVLQSKNLKIGTARIGLSEKNLKAAIEKQKTTYYLMALGFILAGLVISFVLARILTKPLELLAKGMRDVSEGDLRTLVKVTASDEFGVVTKTFNQMVLSLREKLHMEKYLSQSTVNSIRQNRDQSQLKLGGERKYVTALFSDVRGFTAMSERMSPEEVVTLMNTYLNFQAELILAWGGSVDKFVGDEVMAVFEGSGNEINAVCAAVEIQHYCAALNRARSMDGLKAVSIGIGINSGDAVMGNMGSENHMDYTVIGDSINVAARLCGIAQAGQVLISKAVSEKIAGQATWQTLPPVALKGKDKPLEVYAVETVKGSRRQHKRKDVEAAVTFTLAGASGEVMHAILKNLSPQGCLISTDAAVAIGSKLRIIFTLPFIGEIDAIGNVRHEREVGDASFVAIRFEDLAEGVQAKIVQWVHRVNS
jgi:adenylate cyclase